MKEEKYLNIFLTPSELSPNIRKIIMTKLKEKYLYKEFDAKMITDIEIIKYNSMPLSKSISNNVEKSIPVKIEYKIYKPGDIINGEIFQNGKDDRVFVLSYDICEILNIDNFNNIKNENNVNVMLTNIKSTNGWVYFLAEGEIIHHYLP